MAGTIVDAGSLATLRPGEVRAVRVGVQTAVGRDRELLVMQTPAGLRAYENLCRHLPVPLDGGTRDFLALDRVHLFCGTHGAIYRPQDGMCVAGPCAGEALFAHEVVVADGRILVTVGDVDEG